MENTQLSFLTALLGGKLSGDALSGAKALFSQDKELSDGDEFLSLVDGLLTAQTASAGAAESLVPGAPGSAESQAGFSQPMERLTVEELAGAAQREPRFGDTTRLGVDLPARENMPGLVNIQKPATPVMPSAPVEPLTAGMPGQTAAIETPADPAVDNLPEEIERSLDAGSNDRSSRFDSPMMRSPAMPAPPAMAKQVNALTALTENASPEALSHSALTRADETIEIERLATVKTDAGVSATDRSQHVIPIRDQIAAAVVARNGESRLEVRLDPPELGRVMIGFEGEGTEFVRAVVTADSPETLDLMRRNLDVFQRALEAQGFANLDLQFTEGGQRDETQETNESANGQTGDPTEEGDTLQSDDPARYVMLGRLDRRL